MPKMDWIDATLNAVHEQPTYLRLIIGGKDFGYDIFNGQLSGITFSTLPGAF